MFRQWSVWCFNCKIAHGTHSTIQFDGFGHRNVPLCFDKINWINSLPYIQYFRDVISLKPQSIQHLGFKVSPSVPWSWARLLVVPEGHKAVHRTQASGCLSSRRSSNYANLLQYRAWHVCRGRSGKKPGARYLIGKCSPSAAVNVIPAAGPTAVNKNRQ